MAVFVLSFCRFLGAGRVGGDCRGGNLGVVGAMACIVRVACVGNVAAVSPVAHSGYGPSQHRPNASGPRAVIGV